MLSCASQNICRAFSNAPKKIAPPRDISAVLGATPAKSARTPSFRKILDRVLYIPDFPWNYDFKAIHTKRMPHEVWEQCELEENVKCIHDNTFLSLSLMRKIAMESFI